MTLSGDVGGYTIAELDPLTASDDVLRERYDVGGLLHEELYPDDPRQPFAEYLVDVRKVYDWSKPLRLDVRTGDGGLVGMGFLSRTYVETNRHLAWVGADVLPEHRRAGLGREVFRRLVEAARDDGRTVLGAQATNVSPGMEFLPALGFEPKQVGRLSRVHCKTIDRDLMQTWMDAAVTEAPGYRLLVLDDRVPDEHVDTWLELERVMNTAPRDDLEMEDFVPNVERFRRHEGDMLEQGYGVWRLMAVHEETGEWAGFTELYFSPHHPEIVEQGGTGVLPGHRGHGLGRWLKAANVLRLFEERPRSERIETWNAKSNGPMLDINVAMGFEVARWDTTFQAPIETVEARLA